LGGREGGRRLFVFVVGGRGLRRWGEGSPSPSSSFFFPNGEKQGKRIVVIDTLGEGKRKGSTLEKEGGENRFLHERKKKKGE